ncbi:MULTISPECIES: DsbA family protein [Haloarcula]|uniref:Thioredoxin-like fold domain-containing protein n=1 Tax=Haloarcula pellucida TaxID=1427151 RepID=A0A830GLH7_9EURY|nr:MULTISPECIES: thioredoxin domain-containing protein [Halomicroarcula]MBX0349743.1 DsbA family protein [Halomicroarcula pellucida]MDS0279891.1 DsbA family protein [Halomicroarcula sp. S1AR25-4]GGN94091.1 hypothetical protein GCM10009030_20110 [Halomicroarcula pellucida]
MPERPSRREFLAALTAGSAITVSGCASVVDTVGGSESEKPTESERTSVPNTSESAARSTETQTATDTPQATETEAGWSIDDVTISEPSVSLSPVTLPEEQTAYPTMGDDEETLTLYGSWKCPYTREFVLSQLPDLVDEFVRPGDVSVRFRAVAYRGREPFLGADAPRSTRAGLAVWETDPESFWTYFTYVFANQPQERYQWGQPELLTRFASAAGVSSPSKIRQAATSESAYSERVERTLTSANENEIWTVPRVVYDGDVTAPTLDAESTREQFETAADE